MKTKSSNNSINKETNLDNFIYSNLNELSKDNQRLLLTSYTEEKSKGWFDRAFGTKKVAIYISFIICIVLLLIGGAMTIIELLKNNMINYEIWDKVLPIITLTLGYIFGKNPHGGND